MQDLHNGKKRFVPNEENFVTGNERPARDTRAYLVCSTQIICEISDRPIHGGALVKNGLRILGRGVVTTDTRDKFDKVLGRKLALTRAIQDGKKKYPELFTKAFCRTLWMQYFKSIKGTNRPKAIQVVITEELQES
jgi:hypothetical protein